MNHASMRQLISAFVDRELNDSQAVTVREHLRSCAECRLFERGLRSLGEDIRLAGDVHLAGKFADNVLRAVRRDDEEVRSWFPAEQAARRLVAGLSVIAVVFVSLATMARPEDPVLIEPYLTGEPADSSVTRSLLTKESISKDDVLFAALTRK